MFWEASELEKLNGTTIIKKMNLKQLHESNAIFIEMPSQV